MRVLTVTQKRAIVHRGCIVRRGVVPLVAASMAVLGAPCLSWGATAPEAPTAPDAPGSSRSQQASPDVDLSALDHHILRWLAQASAVDSAGAVGRNRGGYIAVSFQRAGLDHIVLGLATKDPARIETGLRAFRYGFDRQQPDGGFPIEARGIRRDKAPSAGDRASSAAFFLSGAGTGYRLLGASRFAEVASAELAVAEASLRRAGTWLLAQQAVLLDSDRQAPNRLLFDALAFTSLGQLLDDAVLPQAGRQFYDAALALQRLDQAIATLRGRRR